MAADGGAPAGGDKGDVIEVDDDKDADGEEGGGGEDKAEDEVVE